MNRIPGSRHVRLPRPAPGLLEQSADEAAPVASASMPRTSPVLSRMSGLLGRLIVFVVLLAVFVGLLGIVRRLLLWGWS